MTDWDQTDDVGLMLKKVRGIASDRQLMFFACGCCRLVETKLPAVRYLADRFEKDAERPMSRDEKWSILSAIGSALLGDIHPILRQFLMGQDNDSWTMAAQVASIGRMFEFNGAPESLEVVGPSIPRNSASQAKVLREVVRDPDRNIEFDPRWRTDAVRGIAAAIVESRAWDRLPILADALQDAGCEDDELLQHCRLADHLHRPGCWALERVRETPGRSSPNPGDPV